MSYEELKTPCLPWCGARTKFGHGTYRNVLVHRIAYMIAHGPIPHGMVIRHKCDNPICVNVDHLIIGTHADNNKDMVTRGRGIRGENCGTTKLKDADILAIREAKAANPKLRQHALAKQYLVDQRTIGRILHGDVWAHVGGPIKEKRFRPKNAVE